MLKEGDLVRVLEFSQNRSKSWILALTKDAELSTHLGKILHNECITKKYGDILSLTKGQVILLKPTPRDFLRSFRLKTQILYEDDCAMSCSLAGLSSGMNIGEAGTGSGALTVFLANHVQPKGHVFSYDINPSHLTNAKRNLINTGLADYVTFQQHDIRFPLEINELDAFFLDFSSPHEAVDNIAHVIKGGGHLICFVPNWGQVEQTVSQIRENPFFYHCETFEITRRNFVVNPQKHIMRPAFRDLVYSGVLIHAVRINPNKEMKV